VSLGLRLGSASEEWNWNRPLAGDDFHDGPPSRVGRFLDLNDFEFWHFVEGTFGRGSLVKEARGGLDARVPEAGARNEGFDASR